MKVRLNGDYSAADLASALLWASGSYREAKKALTKAYDELPDTPKALVANNKTGRANNSAVYLAAREVQKKLGCSDYTALKKLMGSHYRVYWDRLKASGRTLEQVVHLMQNPPEKP